MFFRVEAVLKSGDISLDTGPDVSRDASLVVPGYQGDGALIQRVNGGWAGVPTARDAYYVWAATSSVSALRHAVAQVTGDGMLDSRGRAVYQGPLASAVRPQLSISGWAPETYVYRPFSSIYPSVYLAVVYPSYPCLLYTSPSPRD